MSLTDSAEHILGGSFGNVVSRHIISCEPSDESVLEPFIPMGSNRATGSMRKPGAQYLDLEVQPHFPEEVPYQTLQNTREVWNYTIQYKAGPQKGQRIQFRVQVAEAHYPKGDNEGKFTQSIKLLVIGEGKRLS